MDSQHCGLATHTFRKYPFSWTPQNQTKRHYRPYIVQHGRYLTVKHSINLVFCVSPKKYTLSQWMASNSSQLWNVFKNKTPQIVPSCSEAHLSCFCALFLLVSLEAYLKLSGAALSSVRSVIRNLMLYRRSTKLFQHPERSWGSVRVENTGKNSQDPKARIFTVKRRTRQVMEILTQYAPNARWVMNFRMGLHWTYREVRKSEV